jgi:hypothetical protein
MSTLIRKHVGKAPICRLIRTGTRYVVVEWIELAQDRIYAYLCEHGNAPSNKLSDSHLVMNGICSRALETLLIALDLK